MKKFLVNLFDVEAGSRQSSYDSTFEVSHGSKTQTTFCIEWEECLEIVKNSRPDWNLNDLKEAMRQRGWQFTALNPVELYY